MKAKPLPDRETLIQLLRYNPATGKIAHDGGKPAFQCVNSSGYHVGRIAGDLFLAHRVIWKMEQGEEPPQIDHINRCKTDNRLCNLRASTDQLNRLNLPKRADNASGATGVHWCGARQKWVAQIAYGGSRKPLGRFAHKSDAVAARRNAERELGFSPGHGRTETGETWHEQNKRNAAQIEGERA